MSVQFWFVEPDRWEVYYTLDTRQRLPGLRGGELSADSAGVEHQPDPLAPLVHSAGGVQAVSGLDITRYI